MPTARADPPRPAPLRALPRGLCRRLSHFFTDIDDTLTSGGMLPAESYAAIWRLQKAGVKVVAVTGRPAGWCDHIARMWPVAGVIGENGAFSYSYDHLRKRMKRTFTAGGSASAAREALAAVAARVLREVPGTALAADQAFRISDFAIDYCEDVPPLPPARVDDICRILTEEGVRFKVSSIHVNFWQGEFDKMAGVRLFVTEETGGAFDKLAEESLFIGDSPNDEPLFAGFRHSIAVANVRRFLGRMDHLPEYITEAESADGFCEAAAAILNGRSSKGTAPGCIPSPVSPS